MVIHDLFVYGNSLTSNRFTTMTEQLTEYCEPLQKKVRLGPCKTVLSPPVVLYHRSFQGDIYVVVIYVLCFGVDFCAV